MENRRPHADMRIVKSLVASGDVRSTLSALRDAATLGFDFRDMLTVVHALTPGDFYKSMTTHADHRIWQDVYRPYTAAGRV